MRVLILANGEPPSLELAQRLAREHDLLLATDGAAHRAARLGLIPDIICGDFDSVMLDVAKIEFPNAEFVPTPDQEQADLEKALHVAKERGATSITIAGAAGGRIDHTLANFALLLRYHGEIALRIVDNESEVWAISESVQSPTEFTFAATPGDTISLVTLGGEAQVTLSGVKWPLYDELLFVGTRGVSNIAEQEQITVCVRSGALIVCRLYKTEDH